MRDLAEIQRKSNKQLVDQQSRLLVRDMVNFTPPMKGKKAEGEKSINNPTDKQQGEIAVERDLRRMFQPLDSIQAVQKSVALRLNNAFERYYNARDWDSLSKILNESGILPFRPKIIQEPTKELHNKFRDKRGRVSKKVANPWLVVNARSLETFIKAKKKLVGLAKSGWVKSLRGLKIGVPAWINKGGKGSFSQAGTRDTFSITMANAVGYVSKYHEKIVKRAFVARRLAMERQLWILQNRIFAGKK